MNVPKLPKPHQIVRGLVSPFLLVLGVGNVNLAHTLNEAQPGSWLPVAVDLLALVILWVALLWHDRFDAFGNRRSSTGSPELAAVLGSPEMLNVVARSRDESVPSSGLQLTGDGAAVATVQGDVVAVQA